MIASGILHSVARDVHILYGLRVFPSVKSYDIYHKMLTCIVEDGLVGYHLLSKHNLIYLK